MGYKASRHHLLCTPLVYAHVYARITEESTGKLVVSQYEFCRKFTIPLHYKPNLN